MANVSLKHVYKIYDGDVVAVTDFNLEIDDKEFISVRTAKSGFFEPLVKAGDNVELGRPLANIINPYEGNIIETLYSPVGGTIFFIHNEPLTYASTAVIKILGDEDDI